MKKILAIALIAAFIVAMVFVGTACKTTATATETTAAAAEETAATETTAAAAEETTAAAGKTLKIAQMNPWVSTPYQPAFIEWSEKTAAEYGAEVTVFDGQFDAQKMYDQAQTIIQQKFDGVQLECNDAASGSKLIKMFNDAKIPVVATVSGPGTDVNNKDYPYYVAYVGVDCYFEGLYQGELIVEDAAGQEVNVVTIEGNMSLDASVKRTTGLEDALKEATNVKILAQQPADFDRAKAMAIMENYLTAYPDIDYVACHDDPMAVGAIQAIKAANMLDKMKVLGIGGSTDGCNAIKAGEMWATINHPPEGEGSMSMDVLLRFIINGEKFEEWVKVPCPPITPENVDEFEPKW